jgi:glycosyltransferase involved in cell wall biosynthesis
MVRLGILASHPIQYHAPLFRKLASTPGLDITVYFCHRPTAHQQGVGFGVPFQWDIDLTEGYKHVWLNNRSAHPSVIDFWGCDTPGIRELIEENKYDAFMVHGWYLKSCWQAFHACWRSKTPLLVRGDSHLLISQKRSFMHNLLKRLTYPHFIKRFDACLAYGKLSAEYFRFYGAQKVVISPHFVNNAWFAEQASRAREERNLIRSRWELEQDAFVFLFAGKFSKWKQPLFPIEAIARLKELEMEKIALLMVGDGELRQKCELIARKKELPVRFTGYLNQSRMPQAYAASDCLLLSTDPGETWGLVVNEAMACGLPAIISTASGCAPDLIIEGSTGYTYKPNDIAMLSGLMAQLAKNPALTQKLGLSAFRHVQNYSVNSASAALLEFLNTIVPSTR